MKTGSVILDSERCFLSAIMPRPRYTATIVLTEQCFQQLDLRNHHRTLSTSPNEQPLRGVNLHADRRRSLERVCSACSQLLLREDTLNIFTSPQDAPNTTPRPFLRSHVITKDAFNISARQGCRLCYALKRFFREELASLKRVFENDAHELEFPFSFDPAARTIAFHHPNDPTKSIVFDLVAYPGSTTWPVIRRKPPEVDVASNRSFKQANQWLQDCVKHHPSEFCPILKNTPLPKRVIDVSGVYPRLHSSGGASARYACLSYCWGTSWREQSMTTSHNVDRHSNRIIFENLPQTIQDAIMITKRLNLRYIWIDRLCIVQDDEAQREKELEKMGAIFANAYVTISAATARSCEDGFLHERQVQSRAYTPPIKLPCYSPSGLRDHVMLFQRGSATTREPIHHRAWTLQEDLLSPRVLFYGDFELVWACATCIKTISGIQAEICDTGETEMARLRRLFAEGAATAEGVSQAGLNTMSLWQDLIREYSRRKLSRPDDKLPALSGLAVKFQRLIDGEYLAGLWSCWLPIHLLWKITGPSRSGFDQYATGMWRAPSWSWLSMDSPVEVEVEDKENFQILAKIEHYAVNPVRSSNLFGRLKDTSTHSVTLQGVFNKTSEDTMHQIVEGKCTNSRGKVEVVLDTEPVMSSTHYPEFSFLTIGSVTRPAKQNVTTARVNGSGSGGMIRRDSHIEGKIAIGIVLSPSPDGQDFYNRVGWFRSLPFQTEFLAGKGKMVTIV